MIRLQYIQPLDDFTGERRVGQVVLEAPPVQAHLVRVRVRVRVKV
jgi:hypothetical protein